MNIWERYPSKGTHYEAMKAKAKLHTFEYTCYRGRDRDDWSEGTIQAHTWEEAKNKVENQLVDVRSIYSSETAFAALKADGGVVAWGHEDQLEEAKALALPAPPLPPHPPKHA